MTENAHSTRNGLLCALIFLAAFWAAWPIANMGFDDDWSYIKSAQVFAQTGKLVYNGWATAMLGWQIPWGALFIKLFGFSFTVVKLSTLPIAVVAIFLFHAILVRFGVTPRNAIIGTLTFGLSPLFIPLSASYMTDVPGVFVILLCLYLCQLAATAETSRSAIVWLCLAAGADIVGGTVRQIAWLGVLVMVPSTGWLLRRQRGLLLVSALLWTVGVGCVLFCMHWFSRQLYSVPERMFLEAPRNLIAAIALPPLTLDRMCAELLCLLILAFPVLIPWLPKPNKMGARSFGASILVLLVALAIQMVDWNSQIWPTNVLFKGLAVEKDANTLSTLDINSSLIPLPVRVAISIVVLACFCELISKVRSGRTDTRCSTSSVTQRELLWLVVPFVISYIALLIPRAWSGGMIDRYVLGLMPFAIVIFLWLYQRREARDLPLLSIMTLVLYSLFAVSITHDWFSWQRARLAAIDEVRRSGVPPTEVAGGFEYDGWTQLESGSNINDPRIEVPLGAYVKSPTVPNPNDQCKYEFLSKVPAIHPRYSVAVGPEWCYAPSEFAPVQYIAWLPPFQRTVSIQKVRTAAE